MIRPTVLHASLGLAGIGALAASGAACQSATPASTCSLAQVASYPASPLMLLTDARLDHVPDGFFLLGVDKDLVRWAHIDSQRVAGKEQSTPVPPARKAGPWFAIAGRNAPADTVLIAYGMAAANGKDLDINVVAVAADGTSAPGAATVAATIADGVASGAASNIALATSQTGMRAGLAWTATGSGMLTALVLDGSGQAVGSSFSVDAAARVGCVGFVSGKNDLSLAYFRYKSDADAQPTWVIAETRESGSIAATLELELIVESPSCPLVVATSVGYTLAWQTAAGSAVGVYENDQADLNRFQEHLFASAVQFGGPSLQPPLAGLGLAGNDVAVVIGLVGKGEVWRVSPQGERESGALVFPSESGNMGDISSTPVAGALYSTYADYESHNGVATLTTGQRYLLETTCL